MSDYTGIQWVPQVSLLPLSQPTNCQIQNFQRSVEQTSRPSSFLFPLLPFWGTLCYA